MPPIDQLTILVPVDVSEPEPPSLGVVDLLGAVEVVLLGYFPVPDQAAPALIKEEYEDEAEGRLVEMAEGRDLTEVLVFTHDREATIDRVAAEYGCDAVLTMGEASEIRRVLVPLRGDVNLERILSVTAGLLRAGDERATLFHSVGEDADASGGELLLRGAVERLLELGVPESRVDRRLAESDDPLGDVVALGNEYDLVVLGESEPTLRDRIIGDSLTRIIAEIERPALIVRDVE